MVYEMRVDHLFLRLDGRVFEVLSDQSDYQHRVHVDVLGFARVKGPTARATTRCASGCSTAKSSTSATTHPG